jgi:hypothetical protein
MVSNRATGDDQIGPPPDARHAHALGGQAAQRWLIAACRSRHDQSIDRAITARPR